MLIPRKAYLQCWGDLPSFKLLNILSLKGGGSPTNGRVDGSGVVKLCKLSTGSLRVYNYI